MKILWVKSDFLHPTTKGGHIRTLETLRRLHTRHEVHYVAYEDPHSPEGVERSREYCTKAHPVQFQPPSKRSPAFFAQLAAGLASPEPVVLRRYRSQAMQETIARLMSVERFDSIVCDFLTPAPNFRSLTNVVLFQHNVETMIWERHADHAADPLRRAFFRLQARRMFEAERRYCREAAFVIAVSDIDVQAMRRMFGVERIATAPTGVDTQYFARPANIPRTRDLVFVGSMDWMPNIDGMDYFAKKILPLIRRSKPNCNVTIVGRAPTPAITQLAERDPLITVTGTVPDVRPYLWESQVSIVPLRIGGGTRLKIYESMAAGTPVVSTSVGAEGLVINPPDDTRIADSAEAFAEQCLAVLDERTGSAISKAALEMVTSRFSWEHVTEQFENLLVSAQPAGVRS